MTETRQEKIQRLARESYEVATAKGWHDIDELDENGMPTVRQLLAWCALFHTEVTEYERETAHYYLDGDKPCGKITELADVAIRVWDAMGRCGFDCFTGICGDSSIRQRIDDVTEHARVLGVAETKQKMCMIVASVFYEASNLGLDGNMFMSMIQDKMNYNKSRSYRHGNKLA